MINLLIGGLSWQRIEKISSVYEEDKVYALLGNLSYVFEAAKSS